MSAGSTIGSFTGDIIHFSVTGPREHLRMIAERYAPLGARLMFDRGRRASLLSIMFAGPLVFLKDYLIKAGLLDGVAGLFIALLAAHHATLKQILLYELQRTAIVVDADQPM